VYIVRLQQRVWECQALHIFQAVERLCCYAAAFSSATASAALNARCIKQVRGVLSVSDAGTISTS
jgi:hypothetical protein